MGVTSLPLFLACAASFSVRGAESAWYDGIASVKVISPGDAYLQDTIDDLYRQMAVDPPGAQPFQSGDELVPYKGQFGTKRQAVLLRRGDYGSLEIPVNFYTSIIGVGSAPNDVVISAIKANDTYPKSAKGGLENFWRSVEGLTCTAVNVTWAVSQAAPLRRMHVKGDLYLSQQNGDQIHYTSGGFMADITVDGKLYWGTQQQFFFRNADFNDVDYSGAGRSFVFVGVNGVPTYDQAHGVTPYISSVDNAPVIAEKPYLVEDNGDWHIVVPDRFEDVAPGPSWRLRVGRNISMDDVFVAREGDDATAIQAAIKGKKALLLTPAMYFFEKSIRILDPDFVILGIGLPTLVTITGLSAIIVDAPRVRIASVLIEAGHPRTHDGTSPLLLWTKNGNDGVGSDIFTRVGAFAYQNDFHNACTLTHADIHVEVRGDRLVLDNAWLWHADHDDCTEPDTSPASDYAYSGNGLVVYGDNVTAYGLAVEHTMMNLVNWEGEGGQIFFFQSELPYHNPNFVDDGYCGYKVGYDVQRHTAYGVGIYQVFPTYTLDADMRVPPTVDLTNVFAWSITSPSNSTLGSLICSTPGREACHRGDCDGNSCHFPKFPPPAKKPIPSETRAQISQKNVYV